MGYIRGVCIKSYIDEEDVERYDKGEINKEDINVYEIGDESDILLGLYDKYYWEPLR